MKTCNHQLDINQIRLLERNSNLHSSSVKTLEPITSSFSGERRTFDQYFNRKPVELSTSKFSGKPKTSNQWTLHSIYNS